MQQSNAIVGTLIIAYFVFIVQKGELGTYLTLLRGGGAQATSSGTAGNSFPNIIQGANNLLKNAGGLISTANTATGSSGEFSAGYPVIDSGNPLPNPADY